MFHPRIVADHRVYLPELKEADENIVRLMGDQRTFQVPGSASQALILAHCHAALQKISGAIEDAYMLLHRPDHISKTAGRAALVAIRR